MSQTTLDPILDSQSTRSPRWMVRIFNNDTNSFDEVISILMVATKCDAEEASIEAWEAHHYGSAPVHFSDKESCERIAQIIETVGVRTEVASEWND